MSRFGRRHDFQPTSLVRDAGDLPPVAEDDSSIGVGPEDLHDLACQGGVRWYQRSKAIGSHRGSLPSLARGNACNGPQPATPQVFLWTIWGRVVAAQTRTPSRPPAW